MSKVDMSKMLSGREVQPGSERYGDSAEARFLQEVIGMGYEVVKHPRFLQRNGIKSMVPDLALIRDGKGVFIEVKRQKETGNAHERVYKYFTPKLQDRVKKLLGSKAYPVYAVFCDGLTTSPRFAAEFDQNLESGSYLLWTGYDSALLKDFLGEVFCSDGTFDTKNISLEWRK